MPTFFQPVDLPERCYLEEVLYWVAFQRLPVVAYQFDGKEIRENDEMGNEPGIVGTELSEIETQRAKIPPEGWCIARRTWTNGSSPVYSKYVFHAHQNVGTTDALLVSMPTRALRGSRRIPPARQ
jgi:hypothetical protein